MIKKPVIILLLFAGMMGIVSADSGTEGEYAFNQSGSYLEDFSGNNRNGTIDGSPNTGISGVFDDGWDFDGSNDGVNFTEVTNFPTSLQSSYTIIQYIETDDLSANRNSFWIKENTDIQGRAESDGTYNFYHFDGSTTSSLSTSITTNTDTCIASTYNGSSLKMYKLVNGDSSISQVDSASSVNNARDANDFDGIGYRPEQRDRHWDGTIYEFDVFNKSLSQSESENWCLTGSSTSNNGDPTVTIDNPGNETLGSSDVWINASADESGSFTALEFDGVNETYDGNKLKTNLSEGKHTAKVYFNDTDNNTGTDSVTFTVDIEAEEYSTADWAFNESGSTLTDWSSNDRDGKVSNQPTTGISGIFDQGWSFDGVDDGVNFSESNDFDTAGMRDSYAIVQYFETDDLSATRNSMWIKEGTNLQARVESDDTYNFYHFDGSTTSSISTSISTNTDTCIAATYDGSALSMYKLTSGESNISKVDSVSSVNNAADTDEGMAIGKRFQLDSNNAVVNEDRYWSGNIYEFDTYNSSITQDEAENWCTTGDTSGDNSTGSSSVSLSVSYPDEGERYSRKNLSLEGTTSLQSNVTATFENGTTLDICKDCKSFTESFDASEGSNTVVVNATESSNSSNYEAVQRNFTVFSNPYDLSIVDSSKDGQVDPHGLDVFNNGTRAVTVDTDDSNSNAQIDLWNVSDPENLTLIDTLSLGSNNHYITVGSSEDYAYMGDAGTFYVIDITGDSLSKVGSVNVGSGNTQEIVVNDAETTAYMAIPQSAEVHSIDISTKSSPTSLDTLSGTGSPNYMDYVAHLSLSSNEERLAYTSYTDYRLGLIDASSPSSMSVLDTKLVIESKSDPHGVLIDGDNVYVSAMYDGNEAKGGLVTYNRSGDSFSLLDEDTESSLRYNDFYGDMFHEVKLNSSRDLLYGVSQENPNDNGCSANSCAVSVFNVSDRSNPLFMDALQNTTVLNSAQVVDSFGDFLFTANTEYPGVSSLFLNDTRIVQDFESSGSKPTVNILNPTNSTFSSSSVDLNVTSSEPSNTTNWKYSLNSGNNQSFTPNTTLTGLSNQQHNLDVYANHTNGNILQDSVTFTVDTTIDTTPPTTTSNLTQSTYYTNEIFVELNATDQESSIENLSYNAGEGWNTVQSNTTTFNLTGYKSYDVRYYAWDTAGNQETENSEIVTLEALNADFFYNPDTNINTQDTITFDAGTTSGNINSYSWDFQNDGTFDATGETVNHQFNNQGTYTVLLQVEDAEGNTDTHTETLNVEFESDTKSGLVKQCSSTPFCYEDNSSFETSNPVNVSGSFTELDENKAFEWNVNATGTEGTYDFFGFYNSTSNRLNGTTYTDIKQVEINASDVNFPPQPDFNIDITNLNVDVDASPSTDDGTITSYEWDWTSDGNYEATGLTNSHTYGNGGEYTVTLRVTDNNGSTSTASKTVSVSESTDDGGDDGGGTGGGGGTGSEPSTSVDGSTVQILAPHRGSRYHTTENLRIQEGGSSTITIEGIEHTVEVKDVENQREAELIVNGIQGQYRERDSFELLSEPVGSYTLSSITQDLYIADIVEHNNTGYVYLDIKLFSENNADAAIGYNYTVNNSATITIQKRRTGIGNPWQNISTDSITQTTDNQYSDIYHNFDKGIHEIRAVIEDSSGNISRTDPTGVYIGDVPYINITNPSPGKTFEKLPNGENGYSIPLAFKATTLNGTEFTSYYTDSNQNIYFGQSDVETVDDQGVIDSIVSQFNNLKYIDSYYDYVFEYNRFLAPPDATFTSSSKITLPSLGEYTGYANSTSNYSESFSQWNATSIGVPIEITSLNTSNINETGIIGEDDDIGRITTEIQEDKDFVANIDGEIFTDPLYFLYEPYTNETITSISMEDLETDFSFTMSYNGNMTVNKTLVIKNSENKTARIKINPSETQFNDLEIDQTVWENNTWKTGQHEYWLEYRKDSQLVYSTENRTDGKVKFNVEIGCPSELVDNIRCQQQKIKNYMENTFGLNQFLTGTLLTMLILFIATYPLLWTGRYLLGKIIGGAFYILAMYFHVVPALIAVASGLATILWIANWVTNKISGGSG